MKYPNPWEILISMVLALGVVILMLLIISIFN